MQMSEKEVIQLVRLLISAESATHQGIYGSLRIFVTTPDFSKKIILFTDYILIEKLGIEIHGSICSVVYTYLDKTKYKKLIELDVL